MKKIKVDWVEKSIPGFTQESLIEMHAFLLWLNFPPLLQRAWLEAIELEREEIEKVLKVAEHYKRMKEEKVGEKRMRSLKRAIEIDVSCFKEIYSQRLLMVKSKSELSKKAIAEHLKRANPNCVLFEEERLKRFFSNFGIKRRKEWEKCPDFVLFDPEQKKIISYDVVWVPS